MKENSETRLIEEYAQHFNEVYKMPPLSAKLIAYFLVEGKEEGYTFDELVEMFKVSKSAISTSLNLLIQQNFLIQITKLDERKRRYKINPKHLSTKLLRIKDFLNQEKVLTEKLLELRKNKGESKTKVEATKIYSKYLSIIVEEISNTTKELESIT